MNVSVGVGLGVGGGLLSVLGLCVCLGRLQRDFDAGEPRIRVTQEKRG